MEYQRPKPIGPNRSRVKTKVEIVPNKIVLKCACHKYKN